MVGEHYTVFIEEAFIKPIRSVLIVDDDYPTFEEMLNLPVAEREGRDFSKEKAWYKEPTRVQKVIEKLRDPELPLLVDIHDGTNVSSGDEVKVAAHLHQSDLLVLDYQLDRTKAGDGTLAIKILRSVTQNDHFNLVVVHTSEDLEKVFRETLLSLLSPSVDQLSEEEENRAQNAMISGDDQIEGFSNRLASAIDVDQYLDARDERSNCFRKMGKSEQPFAEFAAVCDEVKLHPADRRLVLKYLLKKFEDRNTARFNNRTISHLTWNNGGPNRFIAAGSAFIAFSQKTHDDDLLADLREALKAWQPPPSRLILAKLRAEMDEYGVMAQSSVLENKHALAHWYRQLLDSKDAERRWRITESVSRHAEQLMAGILPRVEKFAENLINAEAALGTPNELSKLHFGVDFSNDQESLKARNEHNVFVCSKPAGGWHLTTGHVFTVGDDYWICVSPACDMVPRQVSQSRIDLLGRRLPFMAVKLQPLSENRTSGDHQTGRYLFLRVNGAVKKFCFNDPSGDDSAPQWHLLHAEKLGELSDDFAFEVFVTEQAEGGLTQRKHAALVVAQLRYEYALNLVQRLGGTLTRIGLDFV